MSQVLNRLRYCSSIYSPQRLTFRHGPMQIYRFNSDKPKQDSPQANSEEPKNPQSSKANPSSATSPITWKSLIIGGAILTCITVSYNYARNLKFQKMEEDKKRSFGKAVIGGSFELVDTEGKLRTSEEFKGQWLLIYFGFTHCPDVCPEELDKLAKAVDELTKSGVKIVPIFISVDPERDTPQLVKTYLNDFSDKFIGLTGSKEQVEKATRAYRVYYSVGPKDKDNDYIVDHTIISYLVGPEGELMDYFGQTREADDIVASTILQMKSYKK